MKKLLPKAKLGDGIVVRWIDSTSRHGGWTALEDVDVSCADIATVGIFVRETKTTVTLALSMDCEGDELNCAISIPKGCISAAKQLPASAL